jgi:hypothetical protein
MSKTEILAIGRNEEILETVIRLINKNEEWNGTGASSDEDAIEKFHHHHIDVVLLTNGITNDEELKLRKIFILQQPDVIILQHYGGGSGLLTAEIKEALDSKAKTKKYSFSVKDGFGDVETGE